MKNPSNPDPNPNPSIDPHVTVDQMLVQAHLLLALAPGPAMVDRLRDLSPLGR